MLEGIKNQSNIDAKSMLEKGMQQIWKMMQKWSQNGCQNRSKMEKKRKKGMPKSMRKNGREKERQGPERDLAAGAQEHTIQQDRVLSITRKTSKKKNL